MAPDSRAAVLRPLLRRRLLPGAAVPAAAWREYERNAGREARRAGRRERRTAPSRGRAEAPREGGVRQRRGVGGDKATPRGGYL